LVEEEGEDAAGVQLLRSEEENASDLAAVNSGEIIDASIKSERVKEKGDGEEDKREEYEEQEEEDEDEQEDEEEQEELSETEGEREGEGEN
jgi:hypothetical protein